MQNPREFLASLFDVAVEAANPDHCIRRFLPARPTGRTVVVGAGKGSAQLARALENHWQGPLECTIVTRYGYGAACRNIVCLLPKGRAGGWPIMQPRHGAMSIGQ